MLNTPVWEGGLKVTVKQGPNRVISSVAPATQGIEVEMPSEGRRTVQADLRAPTSSERDARPGKSPGGRAGRGRALVMDLIKPEPQNRHADNNIRRWTRLIRGQFWVYCKQQARLPSQVPIPERFNRGIDRTAGETGGSSRRSGTARPAAPARGRTDQGRRVLPSRRDHLRDAARDRKRLTWRALVELETNSVLYLRALASDVNGQVFVQDPPTKPTLR